MTSLNASPRRHTHHNLVTLSQTLVSNRTSDRGKSYWLPGPYTTPIQKLMAARNQAARHQTMGQWLNYGWVRGQLKVKLCSHLSMISHPYRKQSFVQSPIIINHLSSIISSIYNHLSIIISSDLNNCQLSIIHQSTINYRDSHQHRYQQSQSASIMGFMRLHEQLSYNA